MEVEEVANLLRAHIKVGGILPHLAVRKGYASIALILSKHSTNFYVHDDEDPCALELANLPGIVLLMIALSRVILIIDQKV